MSYTSAQIVALACAEAKCPGFIVQGGQYLNLALRDLWMHRDLKVCRKTQTIVVQSGLNGPFNLESDYQRTYDLFFLLNGLPLFLDQISSRQYDAEFKDPSVANYPYEYNTDLSTAAIVASGTTGQIYVYPQSNGALSLTHRYMNQQPDIVTPETSAVVPWFADQDYLVKATALRLMGIVDDERAPKYREDAESMLRTHLIMAADDEQQVVNFVTLDPQRFRPRRSLKPTKLTN